MTPAQYEHVISAVFIGKINPSHAVMYMNNNEDGACVPRVFNVCVSSYRYALLKASGSVRLFELLTGERLREANKGTCFGRDHNTH